MFHACGCDASLVEAEGTIATCSAGGLGTDNGLGMAGGLGTDDGLGMGLKFQILNCLLLQE